MKTVPVVFVLLALAFGMTEARGENGLGFGLIVGEPTGASIKKWIGETQAVDAAAALSIVGNGSFQFHADYLFHNFSLLKSKEFKGLTPVYFGAGGRIKLDEDTLVGIRIPFGISYMFADAPFDIFAEVVPVVDVSPDTALNINVAVGVRYYFR